MRKFSQINESVSDDKEPIDVEIDVVEFKKKFTNSSSLSGNAKLSLDRITNRLDQLVGENPTMTDDWSLHCIYNDTETSPDDWARETGSPIIIVKAVNNEHARLKASIILENREIFTTGFYKSVEISDDKHQVMISELEAKLKILMNPK